jgi:predicted nucleic acid-binding protein
VIVDTNILIDALRGRKPAIDFFEASDISFSISVLSIAELYSGVRGEAELLTLQTFISSFTIYSVDEAIATEAGGIIKRYSKSHSIGIADAIIGATSLIVNEQLATLNTKDFPMLTNVLRPY